jgi:hypothetical protein
MIGRKIIQIRRIILVIVIMRRPGTVIIMTADTGIEVIEKEDSVKPWKKALDRGMIIGKHDGRTMFSNLRNETSVTS